MQTRHAEVEPPHLTSIDIQGEHEHCIESTKGLSREQDTHTNKLYTQILPSILPGVPSLGQNKSRGVKRGSIRGKG